MAAHLELQAMHYESNPIEGDGRYGGTLAVLVMQPNEMKVLSPCKCRRQIKHNIMTKININYCINNNAIIGLKNIVSESICAPRGMRRVTYMLALSSSYQPAPELNDNSIFYDYCNNSGAYLAD